jgi:hypothetical protein
MEPLQTFQPQIQTFTLDRLLTNVKIPTISQDYRQTFAQNPSKRLEAITNSCVVRLNARHESTGRLRHYFYVSYRKRKR